MRLSGAMVSQESIASLATDFGARSVVVAPAEPVLHIENPMTSTPLTFRNSRRSRHVVTLGVVMVRLPLRHRRALDRGDDTLMRATAAEVSGQRTPSVALAGVAVFGQEGRRGHDHAVEAVAALRGLLVDEGLLELRRLGRSEERRV